MEVLNKSAGVRSRIEPELKESATQVLAECGLNLSDAIRLFLRQVVAQQGLPFEVRKPNPVTQAAMIEARSVAKARFATAPELFNALEKSKQEKKPAKRKSVAKKTRRAAPRI